MKLNSSLLTLLASAFVGVTFTACSNGDDLEATVSQETNVIDLIPSSPSKIMITSGDYTLKTSTGVVSRADGDVTAEFSTYKVCDWNCDKIHMPAAYAQYADCAPAKTDRDESVSQAEYDAVMAYIKANPTVGSKDCFDLITCFIQNVGSSKDSYTSEPDQNGATQTVVGGDKMDYLVINGNHVEDYNAVWGLRRLLINCPITGNGGPSYHDSYGTSDNQKSDLYKFVYYDWDNDGNEECYLCFDYAAVSQNGNVAADGVYNDWVIKIIPADGTTGGSHKTPKKETTPTVDSQSGQIEVNLALNAEKEDGDYIASKLSIHVRDTSDVEVFIPVPAEYYCKADDMFILKNHVEGNYVYNETIESVSMVVAGQTVTLTCTYSQDGITVKTEGINAAVLKELRTQYGDGLNFEIWNYYFTDPEKKYAITREFLQTNYLNNSTCKCTNPIGEYVNTINNNDTYNLDCVVTKVN